MAPISVAIFPGTEFHRLWASEDKVVLPVDGTAPSPMAYFPSSNGFRFGIFTVPPNSTSRAPKDLDIGVALAELEEKLPGLWEHLESDHPGMHTTATVDYGIVLSGEAILELDNQQKVTLRPGDTYIQNGTRHRWSNKGEIPAVIAVTLIGATPPFGA
ncbi:MAG: cupin domain-containing protein [Acidimicrobiales bacterium]